MKRILVTGATGFIGRHALPALIKRGFEVHAVSHLAAAQPEDGVRWHQADLLDPVEVRRLVGEAGASHLLHFAWYAVPKDYRTSSENLRWVQATIELVRAFHEYGGERAVLAGTCFEYDARYGFCSEALTALRPSTFYGVCKSSLQQMMTAYSEQSGLSIAWGRIFFLYGPFEPPGRLVSSVVAGLLRHELVNCSHGNQLRDFMHVADVADAMTALADSTVTGPVNIGSGKPVPLRDIIFGLADRVGARELINLGAIGVPADDPPMISADVRRLRVEVGWQPSTSLAAGLADTVCWWSSRFHK
jgi:nucleoside-diphosphate-sugar epimerase